MKDKSIFLLVKPTHECNFNCSYCYDKKEKDLLKCKKITNSTINKLSFLLNNSYKDVRWCWHGGEPLIISDKEYDEYYKNIIKKENTNITFAMQSNGSLINEERIKFLKEKKIDYSVSYDFTNNNNFRKKEINLELLKDYSFINVIDFESSKNLIFYYEFVKKNNIKVNFNKIFLDQKMKTNIEEYTNNFIDYFKYYIYDLESTFEDKMFMSYFNIIFGLNNKNSSCSEINCINNFLCVNPEGDVFPCDRFGVSNAEKYNFGNIKNFNFSMFEYKDTLGYKNYIKDYTNFKESCEECEISTWCNGGCPANRVDSDNIININLKKEEECYFYKKIFNFIFDIIFNLKKDDLKNINPFIFKKIFEEKIILKFMIKELDKELIKENILL